MLVYPTGIPTGGAGYTIENAVWFDGSADSLSKTFSSAGTEETWSYSVWIKRSPGGAGSANAILEARADGNNTGALTFTSDSLYLQDYDDGVATPAFRKLSNAVFRDPTAWMHIIAINDTNNSTAADRHRLYVNGVRLTSFSTDVNSSAGYASAQGINSTNPHYIGFSGHSDYFNGYMAEAIFVDGTALTSTVDSDNKLTSNELGEFDDNGVWVPKKPSGFSFGSNGFHLDFKVAPGTGNGAGTDVSGNGNHFTDNSMTTAQQVTDSPTDKSSDDIGNFCTLNPLDFSQNAATLSEGNLKIVGAGAHSTTKGTVFTDGAGKFVWECTVTEMDTNVSLALMRTTDASTGSNKPGATSNSGFGLFDNQGSSSLSRFDGSNMVTGMSGMADGDMYHIEFNNSTGDVYVWRKASGGTWTAENSGNSVTSGAGKTALAGASVAPSVHVYQNSSATNPNIITFNFGATSFDKTPSSNYVSLNTANLAAPTVTDPQANFGILLYKGNGASTYNVIDGGNDGDGTNITGQLKDGGGTGTRWTPDWVWIKNRTGIVASHHWYDTVRGANAFLKPNTADAEDSSRSDMLKSFDAGGFTLGADASEEAINKDNDTYVAWCWKAGGAPTTDNTATSSTMDDGSVFKSGVVQSSYLPSGSPGKYPKKMSIAEHGGFSIVEYVGTGGNTTIPHGLDRKPEFLIFKRTNTGASTVVWHSAISVNDTLSFAGPDGSSTQGSTFMQSTAPNETVVSLGSQTGQNGGSDTHILYSMAKTPGLIGIGSYTGNDSPDGPMVVVDDGGSGFKPAWVMIKRSNAGTSHHWRVWDSVRSPFNVVDDYLTPSATNIEAGPGVGKDLDFIANGFKIRTDDTDMNALNGTYIYLAFAEDPFGGDSVAQARAR